MKNEQLFRATQAKVRDEIDREKYYKENETELIINSDLVKIYDEIENEDKNTYYIEQEFMNQSSSEDEYDDY